ncbi:hypothetical protein [Chitiniphilus shinanonensis]|uniref:hypothetical protein n=1 Tax=Chitiniphilus shinanonensis TaxID=553088 RepID=UPI00333FBCCB
MQRLNKKLFNMLGLALWGHFVGAYAVGNSHYPFSAKPDSFVTAMLLVSLMFFSSLTGAGKKPILGSIYAALAGISGILDLPSRLGGGGCLSPCF